MDLLKLLTLWQKKLSEAKLGTPNNLRYIRAVGVECPTDERGWIADVDYPKVLIIIVR